MLSSIEPQVTARVPDDEGYKAPAAAGKVCPVEESMSLGYGDVPERDGQSSLSTNKHFLLTDF